MAYAMWLGVLGSTRKTTRPARFCTLSEEQQVLPARRFQLGSFSSQQPWEPCHQIANRKIAGKDDMQEDETMSSEASEEESHSASGGVGVDEEVSDSSNNNTMREEDRLRLKAPTQPFPPLLYINIPYSQVFFQFLPHVIS